MNVSRNPTGRTNGFEAAADHIVEAKDEVKKQAIEYSDELVEAIKEKPIKSILIASAIGVIFGKFFL